MEQNPKKLSEGLVYNIIDQFFKSMQNRAGEQFYNKVKNTDLHPEVKQMMKKMADDSAELERVMKKYHLK